MTALSAVQPLTDVPLRDRIRRVLKDQLKDSVGIGVPLDHLKDSTDLYRAGMSSHSSVLLMVALENEFGLEFPDGMLSRDVFESIDSIATAIESVQHPS